jgi:outer membrane immunogenic protein
VTGGVAFLQGEFSDTTRPDGKGILAVGGAFGGGMEWGIAPQLSVKAEGLYLAFDEDTSLANVSGVGVPGDSLEIDDSFLFRLGGNWRPWQTGNAEPAPVVASYGDSVVTPYNWSGIYAGPYGGWGGLRTDGIYNPLPLPNEAIDLTGVNDLGPVGGGQIGLNWQKNWMVFGVEGDVAAVDWNGQESEFANLDDVMQFDSDVLATLRGRVGFAENDLLFYVTGGLAFSTAGLDNTQNEGGRKKNLDAFGGVAGLGMEWGVTSNFSVKTEGLFMTFSEITDIQDIGAEGDPGDFFLVDDGFVARLGANYRFNPLR